MKRLYLILVLCIFAATNISAQNTKQSRHFIRQGNRHFRAEKYEKSQASYMKALEADANNAQAVYNLGCAYMLQQNDSAAVANFAKASKIETDKHRRSMSYHNMGVIFQNRTMYDKAIEAYKESLRLNPTDNETRYNLALCQKMQKKQPQKDKNKNQNQDKNKEKNKDKQQQQQQNQQQQNQQQQQDKQQMSRDNAEQLLQAAMQQENATRKKVQQAQGSRRRNLQKNW